MKQFVLSFLVVGLIIPVGSVSAATTNIYFTQFEPGEGYNAALNLVGQAGWQGDGTGGNGLVSNFIPGQGQQAYVGFAAPTADDDLLFVWQPLNFNPVAAGYPIVKFSTQIQIQNSANGEYDFFQWRAYNSLVQRLFTLDFDNYFTNVNYRLDGTNVYVDTGVMFARDTTYTLAVTMNFASNRWSATLNDTLITTNQPITTTNALLTLGDMDAVWLLYDPEAPGDNYMVFDNYRVTAETMPIMPAQVQFRGRTGEGWALLRVFGDNGTRWALDATTNLVHWTAVKTNPISGTYYDQEDTGAAGAARRFYRARWVP
jgi:hypothetical protein